MAQMPPHPPSGLLARLRAGFRWWMIPVLILLFGGILGLALLASLSALAPTRYSVV